MKLYLYSYKPGSKSAKDLATALDIKRIKHERSRFRHANDRLVINWGSSTLPSNINNSLVLNHPFTVFAASNKLKTLQILA